MKTIISVELMRRSDAYTIEKGTDSKELMYRAGQGVFKAYPWRGKTAVVCGSGNNAGDGYVLALLMKEEGLEADLFLLSEKFSKDGWYYFKKCREEGISYQMCDGKTDFGGYEQIADCIFGTGFRGDVRGSAAEVIENINKSGKSVISVDINSGMNGDSGSGEKCVISDVTVSVGWLKTGFFLRDAPNKMGRLVNCDIGIELAGNGYTLIERGDCADCIKIEKPFFPAEMPQGENPVSELIAAAKERCVALVFENILTDGKNTYIFEDRQLDLKNIFSGGGSVGK